MYMNLPVGSQRPAGHDMYMTLRLDLKAKANIRFRCPGEAQPNNPNPNCNYNCNPNYNPNGNCNSNCNCKCNCNCNFNPNPNPNVNPSIQFLCTRLT